VNDSNDIEGSNPTRLATEGGSIADESPSARASRSWRTVWRLHFYAGVLSIPMMLIFSLTGLIILYTDPINRVVESDRRTVEVGPERVSLDQQLAAARAHVGELELGGIATGKLDTDATVFNFATESDSVTRDVFVDPYTGRVLGAASNHKGTGIVGLANRLHGELNNETVTVSLPMLDGILNEPNPIRVEVAVFDLLVEIAAVWGLVLAISGLYLWWPRKRGSGRPLFRIRLRKRGRARWRDLHAVPGVLLSFILVFFIGSGLAWSAFSGGNWYSLNQELAAPPDFQEPTSGQVTVGDLDVFGNRIPWVSQGEVIPDSRTPDPHHADGEATGGDAADTPSPQAPARIGLDAIATQARTEGALAGFTIALPYDDTSAYTVSDPWPARTTTERIMFFDQYTGVKIGESNTNEWGQLAQATEWTVQTHMGTQFGIANRILMTSGCILILWSILTATIMWWKRRPTGKAGLPRRAANTRLRPCLVVIAIVLGIVFPAWGLSVILVLLLDRLVIRNFAPLRRTFGMR
jgi:uncharacterized iron-regulated membrane protein